jgi:hypothetical protein
MRKRSSTMYIMQTIHEACESCDIDKPCNYCLLKLDSDISDYLISESYNSVNESIYNEFVEFNEKCLYCVSNVKKSFVEKYYCVLPDFEQSCRCIK